MALKTVHDKLDEIPEEYRALYTEKGGKWELTGIEGVKTVADVDRLNESLRKERKDHKDTKDKLAKFDGLEADDVRAKLDSLPDLELAAKNALDAAKVEELVTKRVEATIKSRLAPTERELAKAKTDLEKITGENKTLTAAARTRTIHDEVRKVLAEKKVIPEAHEDALRYADSVFEVTEDGKVVAREGSGFSQGVDPAGWLTELEPKRPHWWPANQGGGARGSGGSGGGGFGGSNPWSADGWNVTEQGKIVREKGQETADRMAKSAGTTVGGLRPKKKAS